MFKRVMILVIISWACVSMIAMAQDSKELSAMVELVKLRKQLFKSTYTLISVPVEVKEGDSTVVHNEAFLLDAEQGHVWRYVSWINEEGLREEEFIKVNINRETLNLMPQDDSQK